MQLISGDMPPDARRRARAKGLRPEGKAAYITHYMGQAGRDSAQERDPRELYPMAFLFEQDPDSTLGAHFHTVDQFQVFIRGEGMLAADEVSRVCIQFVSPFTPYGPIKAGGSGLSYFTLRNAFDPGANEMPASIHKLPPRPRKFRQLLSEPLQPLEDGARRELKEASVRELIAPETDGAGAWLYRIPPFGSITGPDPSGGRGQHWIVIGGALEEQGGSSPAMSCGFLPREEPAFVAKAGPDGAELLAMQYPKRADIQD